jgi:hypothetical protein
MARKRDTKSKRPAKKVKSLPAKTLKIAHAKSVKGGLTMGWPHKTT